MGDFGHIAVFLAMALSALGGALILGGRRDTTHRAGEGMLLAAAAAAASALFILMYLLLTHDYRIAYVHGHADRNMGIGYLVTAVWGGQAGSLLFWAVLQTFYTAAVVGFAKHKPKLALGFLAALQVYFFALVLFHSDPFAPLGRIATDGQGMNPLLLNPYMAVHPPALFLGFVGFSVPVAYVFAMLVEKPDDDEWIGTLRPFILFAWLFLSIGNLLGMVWAYQELGWGGYWGWDPVENASFMPWLTSTALVHTSRLQKSKRIFRFLNPLLMVLTFSLIVFGTFITRSGVIQSVHAFADATVGPWLLGLIGFMVVLFAALAFWRRASLKSATGVGGGLSRENLFVVTAWLFLLSAAFIWIGTMAPLFTELFKGEKVASTPAFFNKWMVPLGLTLFAVLGLCLSVARYRLRVLDKQALPTLLKALGGPLSVGVGSAIVGSLVFGASGPWPVLAFALLGVAGTASVREIVRTAARVKGREARAAARRRLGAHLVHLAVVLLYLGFTGESFTQEVSEVMKPGDTLRAGDFELTFRGLREENDFLKYALIADIAVSRAGVPLGTFGTARFVYHSHPNQPTSEVAIRTTLLEDLFLILGRVDENTGMAAIRAVVNPLVAWIWIGGLVLILGTLVGYFSGEEQPDDVRSPWSIGARDVVYFGLPVIVLSVIAAISTPADTVLLLIGLALTATVLLFGAALVRLTEATAT